LGEGLDNGRDAPRNPRDEEVPGSQDLDEDGKSRIDEEGVIRCGRAGGIEGEFGPWGAGAVGDSLGKALAQVEVEFLLDQVEQCDLELDVGIQELCDFADDAFEPVKVDELCEMQDALYRVRDIAQGPAVAFGVFGKYRIHRA
jgi:hypothetical protein